MKKKFITHDLDDEKTRQEIINNAIKRNREDTRFYRRTGREHLIISDEEAVERKIKDCERWNKIMMFTMPAICIILAILTILIIIFLPKIIAAIILFPSILIGGLKAAGN